MGKDRKGKDLGKWIDQRDDGRYRVRTTGAKDTYFSTEKEAKEYRNELEYQKKHGELPPKSKKTVDDVFEEYIGEVRENLSLNPDAKRRTMYNHITRYKQNIQPVIGHLKLINVKEDDCKKVIKKMENEPYKDGKYYNTATIQRTLSIMNVIFNYAVNEKHYLKKSPVTSSVKTRKKHEPNRNHGLTFEEQTKLFETLKKYHNFPFFLLAAETGMRAGEIIGLRFGDIDWDKNEIHVMRSMWYDYNVREWVEDKPKTEAGIRTIPMSPVCRELLENLLQGKEHRPQAVDAQFEDLVFLNRNGRPTRNTTYDVDLDRLCKKAGVPHISLHDFRHIFASYCVEAVPNVKTTQVIMGHESASTTLNIYAHVSEQQKQDAMKQITNFKQQNSLHWAV